MYLNLQKCTEDDLIQSVTGSPNKISKDIGLVGQFLGQFQYSMHVRKCRIPCVSVRKFIFDIFFLKPTV